MFKIFVAFVLAIPCSATAQWTIQDSHTTADLRSVHSMGNGIAWVSGSGGTVIRTTDDGAHWQVCAIPRGAENLDFLGIQARDAKTAIVMSSGKGELSQLFETKDGCQTWTLLFTNPDENASWDGFVTGNSYSEGMVIGDQVNGRFAGFASFYTLDNGWHRFEHTVRSPNLDVTVPHSKDEVVFAASNSSLAGDPGGGLAYVTGGKSGSFLHATKWYRMFLIPDSWYTTFSIVPIPMAKGASAGAFSFATRDGCPDNFVCAFVVVGGDAAKPNERAGTAAYGAVSHQSEVPDRFKRPDSFPGGFRSAVAYNAAAKSWITVGPNGTDASSDDGRNWRALKPAVNDVPDADRNWNALSLPFVVGPKGRIGKLRPDAFKQ